MKKPGFVCWWILSLLTATLALQHLVWVWFHLHIYLGPTRDGNIL